MEISVVTIEMTNKRGVKTLILELYPKANRVIIRAFWPSGEPKEETSTTLPGLIEALQKGPALSAGPQDVSR